MNVIRTLRFTLRCVLSLGALVTITSARAIVPEHAVVNGAVQLKGVSPDDPIIYDNDWWFDVFDNNYLWAQASLGHARLRGNIVSRDMWDWEQGDLHQKADSVKDADMELSDLRASGSVQPAMELYFSKSNNLPALIAGGIFKHGQHRAFDRQKKYPLSNLDITLLQPMGVAVDKFSSSTTAKRRLETA